MTERISPAAPGIGITAYGMHAPERVVTNADFAAHLDTSDEWISSRTGIRERRFAAEDEFASHLGVKAVRDMLRRDPNALDGVDMVLCATSTPDAIFPSTAALIAGEVGLTGAAAADVSVACSGFVYALALAKGQIAAGLARKVLVVASEVFSKRVDQSDRSIAILFADAAAAMVVGPVEAGFGLLGFDMGASAGGAGSLIMPGVAPALPDGTAAGETCSMNGREVFKFAVRILPQSGAQALEKSSLSIDDIKWIVPHQANIRIVQSAAERFGVPEERFIVNLDRYGNTSAASVPLAIAEAAADGRIVHGDKLLLISFGGGLSWGSCVLVWQDGKES